MLELLINKLHDTRMLTMLFAAIAAIATVVTFAMPLLAGDSLEKRMKAVAIEREKMRQRERERMARQEKVTLRVSPKAYMQTVVEQFNLTKWVGQEAAREKLMQAGYRGQGPYVAFLFFRMVAPLGMLVGSLIYVFLIAHLDMAPSLKLLLCLFATYIGMQLPFLFLKNKIAKRKLSIMRA